jgi:hypothetical protein
MRRIDTTPDLTRGAYIIDHSTETLLADRTTAAMARSPPRPAPLAFPIEARSRDARRSARRVRPRSMPMRLPAWLGRSRTMPPATTPSITLHGANTAPRQRRGTGHRLRLLDDFPEAVVMMQTLRLSGADLVCTATQR